MSAIVGMGGNLGDPRRKLKAALDMLADKYAVQKKSSLYRTAAVGGPEGQPDCYNAIVIVHTDFGPRDILETLHGIERKMGRVRQEKWGPRIIDLDLLDFDGQITDRDGLTLPHPMMHRRAFVLAPLAEVAPDWDHPKLGKTPAQMMENLSPQEKSVILAVEDWPP